MSLDEIPPGSAFAVSASVRLDYAWSYGEVGIGLADGSQALMATLYHGDADGDLVGDVPRMSISLSGEDGLGVRDVSVAGLEPGTGATFRLFLAYADGMIRGQLISVDGDLLWDSGELPVDPGFSPDKLVFSTRASPDSFVEAEGEGIRAFGTLGAAYGNVYAISAYFSDVEVFAL